MPKHDPNTMRTHYVHEHDYRADKTEEVFDPLEIMFVWGASMVKNARDMITHADSYRGVLVGTAALTHNVVEEKLRIYVGYNKKPNKAAPKYCAEMKAIGASITQGYVQREAVFTAGPSDPKTINGIVGVPARILPPCEVCRPLLEDATVVMSLGSEEDIYGVHLGRDLRQNHLLGSPQKPKRRRRSDARPTQEPVYDLTALNWTEAGEHYLELTSDIDQRTVNSLEDLRIVRAEAAVAALTRNVSVAL